MTLERLRSLREEKRLTQQQVADRLFIAQRTYSRYETGERAVPLEVLVEISKFFDVSTDYLLELTDNRRRFY